MAFQPLRIDFGSVTPRRRRITFNDPPGAGDLTALQALNLQSLLSRQGSGQTFWDKVRSGGTDALSKVLDVILRPSYAVNTALDEGAKGHGHFDLGDAASGFWAGLSGKEHTSFSDVLAHRGILDDHKILRAGVGFLGDVVLDPTTYLSFGAGAVVKGGAKAGAYGAGRLFIDDAFHAVDQETAARLLPEAKRALETVQTGGSDFSMRKSLGVAQVQALQKVAAGERLSPVELFDLDFFRGGALEEEMRRTSKALRVGFGNKGVTLQAAGKPIVPLPSRVGRKGGKKILSKAFKPGFGHEDIHRALMVGRHGAERLNSEYAERVAQQFRDIGPLSIDEQLDALEAFEKEGGVLRTVDTKNNEIRYELNPERVAQLGPEQQKFAQAWFDTMEFIRKQDEAFGVKYKGRSLTEQGRLYVPHVELRNNPFASRQRIVSRLTSESGFQKARQLKGTVAELRALHAAGKIPRDLIADPLELLARRVRASANKQADTRVLHIAKRTLGLPDRAVNKGDVAMAHAELTKATKAFEKIRPKTAEERREAADKLTELRKEEIRQEFIAKEQELSKKLNSVKFGRKSRTKAANLARVQRQLDALSGKLDAALKAVDEGGDSKLNKAISQMENAQKGMRTERSQAKKAVKVAQAAVKKAEKGTKHPDSEKAKVAGYRAIEIDGQKHYFPPKVADALERAVRVYEGDDEAIEYFGAAYRKMLANWKVLVTSVNPGYRARNTLSDAWNMYIAGVPAWAMVKYSKRATSMMKAGKTGASKMARGEELTAKEQHAVMELASAYNQGVLSGLFQGDIQQLRRYFEHHGSKKGLAKEKRFIKLGEKVAQDFNRNAENWGRLVHYLYRREHQKLGVARAAREVRVAHFDYEELTEFERKWAKAILPFYTWTRKNIPYQLRQLASRPGKYSTFPKFAFAAEEAAGGGDGDIVPDYIKNQFGFKTPFGYFMPQIGAADLSVFEDPKSRLLPMVSPFAKVPIELATGTKFGTEIPIVPEGHERTPVSGAAAAILGALPGNPANVGVTERSGVVGEGANPYVGYAAGQIPFLNYLVNTKASIRQEQRGTGFGADIAYLTGLNFREADNEAELAILEAQLRDEEKKRNRSLRDEGLLPESQPRQSAYDFMVRQILSQQASRR